MTANNMLEYLFFNQKIADSFVKFLKEKGLEWEQHTDPMLDSIVIKTPEDIDDDLWDELDEYHEKLGPDDQKLLEDALDEETETNAAGIYIQLANGEQTVAQINPDVMNRMLDVISMDEFNKFVETIVSSVENPDDSPICEMKK